MQLLIIEVKGIMCPMLKNLKKIKCYQGLKTEQNGGQYSVETCSYTDLCLTLLKNVDVGLLLRYGFHRLHN